MMDDQSEIIARLEAALDMARRGEVRSISVALITTDGAYKHDWMIATGGWLEMIGVLSIAHGEIVGEMRARAHPTFVGRKQ